MFAVQNGGQCFSSATAPLTVNKYGKSTLCWSGGEVGPWANEVIFNSLKMIVDTLILRPFQLE